MMSVMSWYGGKYILSKKFVEFIPDKIETYVEVFGGGASFLFAKRRSPKEVYNDLNSYVVNFFRVLRDENKSIELARLIELTPYAREEFKLCRDTYIKDESLSDIEKARRLLVANQMSFSSTFHSFSNSGADDWIRMPDRIRLCANRFKGVLIENLSFENIFEKYDSENTLFYCDPPYVQETRKNPIVYYCEMDNEQHLKLLTILKEIKGYVMLSGFNSNLYNDNLKNWSKIEYEVKTSVNDPSKEDAKRIEVLWLNGRFGNIGKVETDRFW